MAIHIYRLLNYTLADSCNSLQFCNIIIVHMYGLLMIPSTHVSSYYSLSRLDLRRGEEERNGMNRIWEDWIWVERGGRKGRGEGWSWGKGVRWSERQWSWVMHPCGEMYSEMGAQGEEFPGTICFATLSWILTSQVVPHQDDLMGNTCLVFFPLAELQRKRK